MENFINFDPLAWAGLPEQPANVNEAKAPSVEPAAVADAATTDDREKILAVGQELLAMGANIAESYSDWLRLGFALADGLGSEGRDLYHQLSAQSQKYNETRCEKQWQECLAKGNGRATIKTFYFMAKQAGVDLSEIGRRFPSNPHFPQPEGEELEYIKKYFPTIPIVYRRLRVLRECGKLGMNSHKAFRKLFLTKYNQKTCLPSCVRLLKHRLTQRGKTR